MIKEKEIRIKPKGTYEKQRMYFHNYQWYQDKADKGKSSLHLEFKRRSLQERAKGLILQNPRPEDLPKYKTT